MGIIQELFVILNIYEYRSNVSATIPANIGYSGGGGGDFEFETGQI